MTIINCALIREALERAEGFIEGFEDDECQEGIADLLAVIRAALAQVQQPPVAGPVEEPGRALTREEVRDAANVATGGRLAPAALEALTDKVARTYAPPRYDHTYDIAFSVASADEIGMDVTPAMFRAALMERIADLDAAQEWSEVLGVPIDTIDVSEITDVSP